MSGPAWAIDDLVAPMGGHPSVGVDVLDVDNWALLRHSCSEEAPDVARRDTKVADWPSAEKIALQILTLESKDLRAAVILLEAGIRLYGFAGFRDGLRIIRGLLENLWDAGLHPYSADVEDRAMPLIALDSDRKLPALLRLVPITARPNGKNFSYAQYLEFQAAGSDKNPWTAATGSTRLDEAERILREFLEARQELRLLQKVLDQRFIVPDAQGRKIDVTPNLAPTRKVLDEIQSVLEEIVGRKRGPTARPAVGGVPDPGSNSIDHGVAPPFFQRPALEFEVACGNWENAEKALSSGDSKSGLAEMTRLSAADHPRARFLRRLVLSEFCLRTRKEKMATVILEELNEQLKELKLANWESPELIARVWGNLYRCYQLNEDTRDKAQDIFRQLCRLDPWQALRWEA